MVNGDSEWTLLFGRQAEMLVVAVKRQLQQELQLVW